jgi:hypothetical protein
MNEIEIEVKEKEWIELEIGKEIDRIETEIEVIEIEIEGICIWIEIKYN